MLHPDLSTCTVVIKTPEWWCDVLIVGMQIVHATVAAHDKDGDGRLSRTEFRSLLAASQKEHQSLSVKVA